MNERWVKVTLISGEDDERLTEAWVNIAHIPVIVNWKGGSKLEMGRDYVYVCKESPTQLLPDDVYK